MSQSPDAGKSAGLEELEAAHGRYTRREWSRYLGESSRGKKENG